MDEKIAIIPWPAYVRVSEGHFNLLSSTIILHDEKTARVASFLKEIFDQELGFKLKMEPIGESLRSDAITLSVNKSRDAASPEEYDVEITPERISITGASSQGVFYGVQSLRCLILNMSGSRVEIPCLEIKDEPRFSWRGFMLDVGRHFHGVEVVKKLLDVMAFLKFNVFHWHLTDDQGWRIEIKKYPKLIEVGSKRRDTQIGALFGPARTGKEHGGYYTQEEIMDVVAYATERFITVIPEIELPGHSTAAIASYPALSCTGDQVEVATTFFIKKTVYCAGKEGTFEFLQDVLDEILALFPSHIIHIGGDETPKARWKSCMNCQRRIEEEHLADEHELQVYFTNRVISYLKSKGRVAMGWNEIIGQNLDPSALVQYWLRGMNNVVNELRNGRKVVMSNYLKTYLNHDCVATPMCDCYHFNPVPEALEQEFHENVLGIEAPLWTEFVRNTDRLYYQLFPRLFAIAENAWTPVSEKDYEGFKNRLSKWLPWLEASGFWFAPINKTDPPRIRRIGLPLHLFFEPHVPKRHSNNGNTALPPSEKN